ncbi:Rieske (2Fe-2S) protein [Geomesophilobacter sediminis]|uniref:Rieske (2Fe-2S) protein n=1 Tax=Geomesophilobacter sediminis TaxID=2798584 RepID=A0A8J7LZA2_9BACT|nr:Rieske (2Fe-2S) protein [Geomesophilobacter sediminis]MBJ6726061.1 Rieske (2Fe-2S) protein [Geomesophilobacter sediminis]
MVYAAKVADVPDWGKKVVEVEGKELLLVKTKGQVYACETECPHQGAPMSGALVKEAGFISCQRHGYRFDLTTGVCAAHPECDPLRIYPVEIRGDEIWVEA